MERQHMESLGKGYNLTPQCLGYYNYGSKMRNVGNGSLISRN